MTNEQRAHEADARAATGTKARAWEPATWRSRPAEQLPEWPDPQAVATTRTELATLPPLVFAGEARTLQRRLGTVAEGKAFVLQAGDCAESFTGVTADEILRFLAGAPDLHLTTFDVRRPTLNEIFLTLYK